MVFAAIGMVAAFLAGRYSGDTGHPPDSDGAQISKEPAVRIAAYSGGVVTADEFQAQFEAQDTSSRRRFASPAGKRELLEALIDTKLLAIAAEEKGYDREPDVRLAVRRVMATKLLETDLNEKALKEQLADQELREFYAKHAQDFQREARVRAAIVFIAAPENTPAERAGKKRSATQLLGDIRAKETRDTFAFGAVARVSSEDAETRARDGDMGFLSRKDMAARWGQEVADAAYSLRGIGSLSEVVESPAGFAVLKLLNLDPGFDLSFESQKDNLRARLGPEKKAELTRQLLSRLRTERAVSIDEAALDSVQFDPSMPARVSPGRSHALEP
ncbi:MAG: peptidylprolyl isomerase [Myxococcaceae bacterium]